jgi:cyanophycin synthetase
MLFPPGAPSRIPIVAVTGTNGKTTTSRMISHIFKGMGRKVGMTSTDGVVIDERLLIRADASGPRSARMVLQNPRVDFAVFEVARGGILREGLGYERNDVAVVLNVQPDHLGLRGIDTVEQLANVKAVLVEAVPRDGHAVLNADDPLVREMRRRCSGQVVWISMEEPGSEVRDMIDAHCRRGGKALVLNPSDRGEMIVVKHGRREMQLAWTHLLPATFSGRARMNVQNVIVDYCHNAPGMRALGDFVDRVGESMEESHDMARPSRIGIIATAGDRRDEDMRELGEIAAQHFDVLIVREDVSLRGRERGETAALVIEGVRSAMASGARCRQVEEVLEEISAVRHAMSRANKGDLVVVCVDRHGEVMSELENWSSQAQAGSGASVGAPAADPDYTPASAAAPTSGPEPPAPSR